MRCPMCLGKGYATDEDIKEYPHRCPNCNGKGFYSVDWQKVRCEVCHGSGKKPITNEEWFCQLTTEEKAKWLSRHSQFMYECGEKQTIPKTMYEEDWEMWLTQPHREEKHE